jgi:8-oxo-dGTP pyrophosphatase MutT (NUDIX family)
MRFDFLEGHLEELERLPLPGVEAHDAILPEIARQRKQALKSDPNPKVSAVAATIFPKKGEATVLLIERQPYDGVHSNQVGFPGGKVEEGDRGLMDTALREMHEELGIDPELPKPVRPLSELYIPPSRFLVHPFVFTLDELPQLIEDEREVKTVIQLPIRHLLDDANIEIGKIKTSYGVAIKTPYFVYDGFKIWGATAMMLSELRQLLKQIQA